MSKVSKECLDGALTALRNFTKEELEEYVHDVFGRARQYDNLMNMRAFDRAMKEINDERLKSFFEDASIKANNTLKFEKVSKKIIDNKVDMRSVLVKRYNNLGDNVASAQKSAQGRLEMMFFRDLEFEEMEFFNSGKNDELIADAYDGKNIENAIAKKIADKIHKYFDYRNSELIISNAMRFDEINEDRMFRQIHDSGRLISGSKSLWNSAKDMALKKYDTTEAKPLWRETIKKGLNLKETFAHTDAVDLDGNVDMKKVDDILNRIFDNITTGKSEIFTKSTVVNDREAVARRSRMFFKFNNMRSFLEYNKAYGKNTLFGALRADIQSSGSKIGMAEMWGDSPHNMYADLRAVQDPLLKVRYKGYWWSNTDNYFKAVMNVDKSSKDANIANFGSNFRTLTSMARLVKITLQSVSDIGYVASFANRMGIGYFKAYTNQLKHIFDLYPNEERKYISKLFKTMVDSHLGFQGRWTDANNSGELMNKISTRYFKAIGLDAFDRGNKVSIMHLMSKHLFENSNKEFGQLNKSLQKWVSKFMNKDEWDLLRKKNRSGLFTTDNVEAVTDDDLRKLNSLRGNEEPLYQMRNDLFRKVYSMFDIASENAVLSPTEFERAWCFQGEAPGTFKGELFRTLSQFKMYTMSYIDRVLVQGYKDADTAQQKIMWATSIMMGTLPLSILSVYLDNLSNGLTMPDWDLMNIPEREKFLVNLLAPSLAIFSGILDPNNQNSSMVWTLFSSPSSRFLSNALAASTALIDGDPEKAAKKLYNAINYMIPLQTTPVISPFINQALGTEAYLQPGQTHIFGK